MHPLISLVGLALLCSSAWAAPSVPLKTSPSLTAEAVALKIAEDATVLLNAAQAHKAKHGQWAQSLDELRQGRTLPQSNYPPGSSTGWTMPVRGRPVFVLSLPNEPEICAQVNKAGSLQKIAITKQGYSAFQLQCYGTKLPRLTVVAKQSVEGASLAGLPFPQISWAAPPTEPKDPAWLLEPAGDPVSELPGLIPEIASAFCSCVGVSSLRCL